MKKLEIFLLSLLLLFALTVRLYKVNRPVADWHSWRQADTAAVSRNFNKDGYNPFYPKFDDMSSQANGLDNPQRHRFVEVPVYNTLVSVVWYFTGINDMYARLVTVVITLGSTFFLYLIVRKYSGIKVALLSAFFFAAIPYNIFYSSVILPGPLMVLCVLISYYFFILWTEKNKAISIAVSAIFASLAILTWPIAALFLLPQLYLAFQKYSIGVFKQKSLWIFAAVTVVPFLLWRTWEARFPEGIPNWQFLINEGNIRFKGAFFRWMLVERLGKLILTVAGFPLFILGVVQKTGKEKLFYYSMLASTILYVSVFASGNIRHDYYQIPIIPTLSIFAALGTYSLFTPTKTFHKLVGPAVALFLIIFMFGFGYYEVQGFYWINKPEIVEAGKAVDRLLPKDATVVAPYNGDAAFLYQTNRRGYPITDRPLEEFVQQGTKYLVSVDVNDAGIQNLANDCNVIEKTDKYVIIEMSQNCIGK